ncbi:MAG: response regulator [Bdellovibrionaceae bacterium]|nr:response regulator [Pseudobdellovibrionaceae bacterium]
MRLVKSSKRILVIEDEIEIGEVISEVLREQYENVHYIHETERVPGHLDQYSYDLILSDINMPKLDGPSLVSLIRSRGILTPVVFVSGNVTLAYALMASRLGVLDILDKPFTNANLLAAVRNVFEPQKKNLSNTEKDIEPEIVPKRSAKKSS